MTVRLRPPRPADAEDLAAVMAAGERADVGESRWTPELLRREWAAPGHDPAADGRVAELRGRLVGYAMVRERGALAFVHPAAEGSGVGAALLRWVEDRERERGRRVHRQFVPATDRPARGLLEATGYRCAGSSWRMVADLERPSPDVSWPAGTSARALVRPDDEPPVHALTDQVFAREPAYVPLDLPAWRHRYLGEVVEVLSVVAEADGGLVGVSLNGIRSPGAGYVAVLAVEERWRRRGLGTALMAAALRAFRAVGLRRAELHVDAANAAALGVYEQAGFRRWQRTDVYERPATAEAA